MDMIFPVENIKCAGCARQIHNRLLQIPGVLAVEVDVTGEYVIVTSISNNRKELSEALKGMGYPEKGTSEGIDALQAVLKSYVSCAIGKVSASNKNERS